MSLLKSLMEGSRSGDVYIPADDEDFDTMRKNAKASKAKRDKERSDRMQRIKDAHAAKNKGSETQKIAHSNRNVATKFRQSKKNIVEGTFASFLYEATEFKELQKNKKPLTDDERSEVMSQKAVWHHGPNGSETPAVWKSEDSDGNVVYVTHTHRAFNTAKTLSSAIDKYHNFIKGTA